MYIAMNGADLPTFQDFKKEGQLKEPIWAKAIYKGLKKKGKIGDTLKNLQVTDVLQGLLGSAIMSKVLPETMDLNMLEGKLSFKPNKNINMSFKPGDTSKLTLDWRF